MSQFYSDERVFSPIFPVLFSLQQWQAGSVPHFPFVLTAQWEPKDFHLFLKRDGSMKLAHLL